MRASPPSHPSKSCSPRRDGAPYVVLALVASALLAWAGCSGDDPTTGGGTTTPTSSATTGSGGNGGNGGEGGIGGSGGSGGDGGSGPVCGPPTIFCGGKCVDPSVDFNNCGGCDKSCPAGQLCIEAQCTLLCAGGATKCGDACVDTMNDPANCGGCGAPCAAGEVCSAGACGLACAGGTTKCGNACADLDNDPANCGACGAPCAAGEVCSAGACGLTCAGGATKCGNACVNTMNDPGNCGACGAACPAGTVCAAGQCGVTCLGGSTKCGNQCVDLDNDPANCGACGAACSAVNGTPVCSGGACASPICNAGFADCDNNPANGCEVNVGSSVLNCGACGVACTASNGTPTCSNGACSVMCNAGFGDCDNTLANGCETSLTTTPAHCGACGAACSSANATPVCSNGACAAPICNSGFGNCDNNPANGCETNLSQSAQNCGTCNNACGAGVSCSAGVCGIKLANEILYNGYYYATLDDAPPSAQYGTWVNNCQTSYVTLPQGWSLAPEDPAVVTNVISPNIWSTHCILFANGVSYGVSTYGPGGCGCSGNQCLEQLGNQYRVTSCERRILIRRPQ